MANVIDVLRVAIYGRTKKMCLEDAQRIYIYGVYPRVRGHLRVIHTQSRRLELKLNIQ